MICEAQQEQQQQQQQPQQQPQLQQQQQSPQTQQPQQQHEVKQEEEMAQSSNNGDRRDSITEESGSKLLTIQEGSTFEQSTCPNTSSPTGSYTSTTTEPLSTGLCLKTQRGSISSNGSAASSSHLAPAIAPATSSSTPSINIVPTTEQSSSPTQEQHEQLPLQSQSVDSNGFAASSSTQAAVSSSSTDSPSSRKSSTSSKGKPTKLAAPAPPKAALNWQLSSSSSGRDEDAQSKLSETNSSEAAATTTSNTQHFVRGISSSSQVDGAGGTQVSSSSNSNEKSHKSTSRLSERAKKKSWYNVIYPNYKSRAEDFKKLFKEVPNDERLIVDYSCALQRDILVQGRLYVSQNYVCFHANIFSWETYVSIKWKDVTAITKEKTALVIPNAISLATAKEKFFFATFASRDKSFLMLFRVWQNTLMNKQFSPQEIWKYVHNCYGDELGLTTDDEDYIDPTLDADTETDVDFQTAIDDTCEQSASSQSINQQPQQSGNSSASSGGGSAATRKSKAKYFFNSSKSSNLNSSANASASGSDNKASGDSKRKSNKKMKPNAKELTLSSVKPAEQTVAVSISSTTNNASSSTATPPVTTTAGSNSDGHKKANGADENSPAMPVAAPATDANKHSAEMKRKVSKNQRQRDVDLASKNAAEVAPTDVSDSSDSEENNIPFVPSTECTSIHEGRQIVHTILPLNVDTLFTMLFSKSKFVTDFHALRKSTDLTATEWSVNEDGQNVRTVNVTVQLAASVGPKTSKVTEYQTMRECSKPGELYSIDINSVNAGIPYADSFSVLIHFCLARTVDDHTMLSVHAQIKYKKSIWGVVKGFIEKNTWAGLEDFFGAQLAALQSETCIPPAKGKGRRPRRGTATQIRPTEEATGGTAQTKTDTLDPQLLSTSCAAVTAGGHGLHAGSSSSLGRNQLTAKQVQQQQLHGLQLGMDQGQHKFRHRGLSIFVILLMCLLLALNVILLLKLWKLEEHIDVDLSRRARMPSLAALKELPTTSQDWLELLRQQELSHETELRKWHQVLQTAIELLKKTEKTLAEVMFR